MKITAAALACLLMAAPSLASSQQVSFDSTWKEQKFSLFNSNDFALNGGSLGVKSNGTVSLLWTALPQAMWPKTQVSWDWAVDTSVPATDLSKKGGDDRNLSLYFIFLPEAAAQAAQGKGVKSLLDNPDVRVLMYIWGGSHARGQVVPSPYLGARGRSIIKRTAGTGTASEQVDLAQDYQRAFGAPVENLVGLAVSADSDDTSTEISARISGLRIQ